MHYIYIIKNTINQKLYVGQTKRPETRWKEHKYFSNGTGKLHQYIHRAMAKYGIENFTFEVIDFGLNQWQADCLEVNYIRQYESRNPEKGYNFRVGGYVTERSEETRKLISEACQGREAWNKGQPLSEQHRKALEDAGFFNGKPYTDERKKQQSEFMKAHPNDGQFTFERMTGNQINKGRKHSEDVNKKKGRKGGNSGSFKPGQAPIYTPKGKHWRLVDNKREYY